LDIRRRFNPARQQFDVPVFIFQGEVDVNTPTAVAKA
jgi:hypothetical protein